MSAANNLRLSSEKIEVVAILREHLSNCEDLEKEFRRFKTVTELSKAGIKLAEIYNYIARTKVDFLKVSDVFKSHSHSMVMILSTLLDVATPGTIHGLLEKNLPKEPEIIHEPKEEIKEAEEVLEEESITPEKMKEDIIFEEDEDGDESGISHFEETILKPIRSLEGMLGRISTNNYTDEELFEYKEIVKRNADLSEKIGFKIVTNMHLIFGAALKLIMTKRLVPDGNVIECMRACLIVIVAVVRGKDVDITSYLNKAEDFGQMILSLK